MHQEYYDSQPGLRRSDLWLMNRSPYHFKSRMEQGTVDESPALAFGIAVHKYILEPDDFFNEYSVAPAVNKRTKAGKEEWEAFIAKCEEEGKEAIDEPTLATIKAMSDAVKANPIATALLTGDHETEYYWTDPITGEALKAKCDCITTYDGQPYIIDYKTTESCEGTNFQRSAIKYGYQFQAGFYTEALKAATDNDYGFGFVVQEKKAPFAIRTFLCSDKFIEEGKNQFHDLLGLYHTCKETDNWFGYEGKEDKPTILYDKSELSMNQPVNTNSDFNSDALLDDSSEDF